MQLPSSKTTCFSYRSFRFKRRTPLLLLFGILILAMPSGFSKNHQAELEFAEHMLLGTSIRGDLEGIRLAKKRLEPLLEEKELAPRTHYLLGFADWQIIYNGFAAEVDIATLGKTGYEHCQQAIQADPNLLDAYVVALQCLFRLVNVAPDSRSWAIGEIQRLFAEGRKQDPEHLGLLGQAALVKIYSNQDAAGGFQQLTRVSQGYQDQSTSADAHQRWWHALTESWLAWQALSQPEPQIEASQQAFQRALALRPDFTWVREAMLQTTESLMMCSADQTQDLEWYILAEDPAGDRQNPTLADLAQLAYARDAQQAMFWFRFQLHAQPNENAFGINLAIDNDQNPKNGSKWWGGSSDFRFDYLVTAWVVKNKAGQYTGTMGIASADAAVTGNFTNLKRNNLSIRIDSQTKAIIIGIPEADLPFHGPARVLAAVGSNTQWNDNLPNQGGLELITSQSQ